MSKIFAVLSCAALSACASTHAITPTVAEATDFSGSTPLTVELSNFDFTPSTIEMEAGRAYAFTISNTGSGGHDFTAPDFFEAAKIAPDDIAKVANGQLDLAGRESVTIHLVPTSGRYKLTCTHAGHAFFGMKGEIVVR